MARRPPVTRAAVIGAGPIGCATAAHLAMGGVDVVLCDTNPDMIEPVRRTGRIRAKGALAGDAVVASVTADPAEAVHNARLVVTAVPASAHETVAQAVAPHLSADTVVMIQPGQTLSALAFTHAARAAGMPETVAVVETLNTVFTARLFRPGEVNVHAVKRWVGFAAYPASATGATGEILKPAFPTLDPCGSVLEVGLHNANATVHPAVTLLNAGRIDRGVDFLFYTQGATRHIARAIEAVDRERTEVLRAYGLPAMTFVRWLEKVYGVRQTGIHRAIAATAPYRDIQAPGSLDTRLLTEDVPCGLVPMCDLAEKAGVDVPVSRSIAHACSILCGVDFRAAGRTLERFGLQHLDRRGILAELGPAGAAQAGR